MGASNLGADRDRKDDFAKSLLGCLLHTRCVVISTSLIHRRKKKRSALALFPLNSLSETKGPVGTATSFAEPSAAGRAPDCPHCGAGNPPAGLGKQILDVRKKGGSRRLPSFCPTPQAVTFAETLVSQCLVEARGLPHPPPPTSALHLQLPASAKTPAFKGLAGSSLTASRRPLNSRA